MMLKILYTCQRSATIAWGTIHLAILGSIRWTTSRHKKCMKIQNIKKCLSIHTRN